MEEMLMKPRIRLSNFLLAHVEHISKSIKPNDVLVFQHNLDGINWGIAVFRDRENGSTRILVVDVYIILEMIEPIARRVARLTNLKLGQPTVRKESYQFRLSKK